MLETLNAGMSSDEIISSYPGVDLCDEVVQMYMWHNGSAGGYDLDGIYFRDHGFISVEKAQTVKDSLVPHYVYFDGSLLETRKNYKKWVPFAGFNGNILLVVCGDHIYGEDLENPVISVGIGELNIQFDSISSMLKTSIEWVKHPDWRHYSGLPDEVEHEIWSAHNPGLWERRAAAEKIERDRDFYQ